VIEKLLHFWAMFSIKISYSLKKKKKKKEEDKRCFVLQLLSKTIFLSNLLFLYYFLLRF
jgi:hypothetical protein